MPEPLAARTLPLFRYAVSALAWSPDGGQLAAGSAGGGLQFWGRECDCFAEEALPIQPAEVYALTWSPNGEILALAVRTSYGQSNIQLWDMGNMDLLATLRTRQSGITALAWSPDGEVLASSSPDGTVKLWGVGK
jgi:WD40 repeat protein